MAISPTRRILGTALPAGLLFIGVAWGLHCADTKKNAREGVVTKTGAVVTTEYASAWWSLGDSEGPSLAAIATASRGTEIFAMGLLSHLGLYRTTSNIALSTVATQTLANGQDTTATAVATTDGGTTIDLFWRDQNRALATKSWNGTSLVSNTMPTGTFLAGPAAAGTDGRVDVFGVGENHTLWHSSRTGTAWTGWTNELGAPPGHTLASLPPAAIWFGWILHVFAVADDGTVWTRRYDNGWTAWLSLSGSFGSGVAAVASGASRLDVFAVSFYDGKVYRRWSEDGGNNWLPPNGWWDPVGTPPSGVSQATIDGVNRYIAPTAVARAEGNIDVYVRNGINAIQLMTIRPVTNVGLETANAPPGNNFWEETTVAVPANTAGCGNTGGIVISRGEVGITTTNNATVTTNSLDCLTKGSSCSFQDISATTTHVPPSGFQDCFYCQSISSWTNDGDIVRMTNGRILLGRMAVRWDSAFTPSSRHGIAVFFDSQDCGATWAKRSVIDPRSEMGDLLGDLDHGMLYVDPAGPVYYVVGNVDRGNNNAGSTRLYRSIDSGATWTRAPDSVPSAALGTGLAAGSNGWLYVARCSGAENVTVRAYNPATNTMSADFSVGSCAHEPAYAQESISFAGTDGGADYLRVGFRGTEPTNTANVTRNVFSIQGVKVVQGNPVTNTVFSLVGSVKTFRADVDTGSVILPVMIDNNRLDATLTSTVSLLYWLETTSNYAASTTMKVRAAAVRQLNNWTPAMTISSGQPFSVTAGWHPGHFLGTGAFVNLANQATFIPIWPLPGTPSGTVGRQRIVTVAP